MKSKTDLVDNLKKISQLENVLNTGGAKLGKSVHSLIKIRYDLIKKPPLKGG